MKIAFRTRHVSRSLKRRIGIGMEQLESRRVLSLNVPAFSSLPGASHTVYLDFDGHVTSGTSWNNAYTNGNPINSPAYSADGDTANFSATELANIEKSWRRVAEDFAPFQINVTTVEPPVADLVKSGSGDTRWGVRVVVTKDVAFNCGCGGIAYINSFNSSVDTPVFVFNTGEKGVGEAASHEVGHSLGLSHDGTSTASYYQGHGSGDTSWSAIMGVGYYVNVSHWDKGEYYGSNNGGSSANYGRGPDDLQIMTTYFGFGYRADDHGGTNASASLLAENNGAVSGGGIIERSADVDVFQFSTGAGNVTLNIAPVSLGANLDIQAQLYNSAGQLVATSNPATALSASFNVNLAADQYFLHIDGVGVGNPTINPPTGYSDYGSLGQYSITGNLVSVGGTWIGISATDATKNEGNSGTAPFSFTVTRSGDTSGSSTVNWSVAGSGSSPANASDFSGALSGTLTFAPTETMATVTVGVLGDTTQEPNEGFTVTLSSPSGAAIATGSASGTILNDDAPPPPPVFNISATDANKAEGTSSTPTPFVFTVTRTGDNSGAASVRYTVSGNSNKKASGSDFVGGFPKNVTVSFAAGQTTADIVLNVNADSSKESNEGFKVTLSSPVNASLGVKTASGTIMNDDGTSAARTAGDQDQDTDGDNSHEDEFELIAVADPFWLFEDPDQLTAEQLSVPVRTWIGGVWHVGDLAHDHDHDLDHDHDHDHDLPESAAEIDVLMEAGDAHNLFPLESITGRSRSPETVSSLPSGSPRQTRSSAVDRPAADVNYRVMPRSERLLVTDSSLLKRVATRNRDRDETLPPAAHEIVFSDWGGKVANTLPGCE